MAFIDDHGLWTADQQAAARDILHRIEVEKIETVRVVFPDQHGVLRGKTLMASAVASALRAGVSISSSLVLKDTSHRTVGSIFSADGGGALPEMRGSADMIMVPDPSTFRVLPWVEHSAWLMCDLYFPSGEPVPFATRQLCRTMLGRLHDAGYDLVTGLEVEFHIFRLEDPRLALTDSGQPGAPPEVSLLHRGYNYLTDQNYDQIEPICDILRRHVQALGMDLTSVEVEFGPSQVEFVFGAARGISSADDMVLFRSSVKQICRRHGYHASFMCRPRIGQVMSSGWHLHQSLCASGGGPNLFTATPEEGGDLSPLGRHWLAGLLENAAAATVFSTPTINGYKRFRPLSLAPDRIVWARDNRGAMLRVIGAPGDPASRIENRVGEPAANPYLYIASQIVSGLDGIERALDSGPSADAPYGGATSLLPRTLADALEVLRGSAVFRKALGGGFIEYIDRIKRAEIERYNLEVSAWEQQEYFDLF